MWSRSRRRSGSRNLGGRCGRSLLVKPNCEEARKEVRGKKAIDF